MISHHCEHDHHDQCNAIAIRESSWTDGDRSGFEGDEIPCACGCHDEPAGPAPDQEANDGR